MADKIDRDRAGDASINTDDLDLGPIDDIELDFPGSGDEGVESGKSRRPDNPKKRFVIESVKALGGGVKSAAKTELKAALPDVAAVASEGKAALDDFVALKQDLGKQLAPMVTTLEGATRKLLPKVEHYLPKKFYQKAIEKLDKRASDRDAMKYNAPSKEQMEQSQIASELAEIFKAQAETETANTRTDYVNNMTNMAMGAMRHKQQTVQLTHLYDATRSIELFHRTQHMAFMKKSLELKYKHIFIARDTFNLLQQSMKTFEGYYKGILKNTALPDMAKINMGDYTRHRRTEKYGNMLANAVGNIRSKIFEKVKSGAQNLMSQAGMAVDMLGSAADMSEMADSMNMDGNAPKPNLLAKGLGWLAGKVGGSTVIHKGLQKLSPLTNVLNTNVRSMRANAELAVEKKRKEWSQSDSWILNRLAEFMPDSFSQSSTASNDLLSKGGETVPFDVITRQSITEIIPGYLGKILHSIDIMRTGDENTEEQVYNVYERKFTGASTLKADVYDRAFGDASTRQKSLEKMIGQMQAGAARNSKEDANTIFKGYEKDINRFFLNHAQYGQSLDIEDLRKFVAESASGGVPTSYVQRVCTGFEHDPITVVSKILASVINDEGIVDKNVLADLNTAITENYRKMDSYKQELPNVFEMYGYRRYFSGGLNGRDEKALRDIAAGSNKEAAAKAKATLKSKAGIVSSVAGDSTLDFEKIVDARADGIDFNNLETASGDAAFTRRYAYDRYRNFDANMDRMRKGGKASKFFADKLSKIKRGAGEAYDKVFSSSEAEASTEQAAHDKGLMEKLEGLLAQAAQAAKTPREELHASLNAAGEAYDKVVNSFERGSSSSSDIVDKLDQIHGTLNDWRKESVDNQGTTFDAISRISEVIDNQGTLFDALVQIDKSIKSIRAVAASGGSGSGADGAELAFPDEGTGWDRRIKKFGRGLKKTGSFIGSGVKNVGKLYAHIYGAALKGAGTAVSGASTAIGGMFNKTMDTAKSLGKWLTHKEPYVDVYVKGKEGGMPLVSARKQREEGIFFKSTGKRVERTSDIDQVCVDANGQIVISEEDLKAGLVSNNKSPIGKIGGGLLALGKGYFSVYGKALTAIGGVAKTIAQGLFGKAAPVYQDIYRKGEVGNGPLVTARKQKEEGVYFFSSGKRVARSSDITEPVCDREKKVLISKEDIEHGLCDVDGKPLGSGATGGLLRSLAKGGAAFAGLAGKVGGNLFDIYAKGYKGAMDIAIGGIKNTNKFLGRALGLNTSGVVDEKLTAETHSLLKSIQADVALIADQYRSKSNSLDKDGDGDIDGSYADQMEKKKKEGGEDSKRVDARDMHVDTNWKLDEKEESGGSGKDGEGGSIFDDLGKLVPKKWKGKFNKLTSSFGKKALNLSKGLGSKALTLGSKGLSLAKVGGVKGLGLAKLGSAKALPFLAKGAGMAAHGLGAAGSSIGGLLGLGGSAAGAAGAAGSAAAGTAAAAGGAGAAGLGSSIAAMATNPVTLGILGALAAGYGIYRGVKGFSKKNALKNVGESEGISKENQLTGEDRMYSALGMNTKFGAKTIKGIAMVSGIHGLIKGIRGNDNPLTDKEIEQGRAKLNRKIEKGLPGYDRILQEYEKAVDAGNWRRARELCGKEADGLIKSMWKYSPVGMAAGGLMKLLTGDKNKEMSKEEISKVHKRFESIIAKGGRAGKNAEKLLSKFDDAVAEGDWKRARELSGKENRGLFGKLFQDSKGKVQWGKVIGLAAGGIVGYGIGALFTKADVNKPMTEEEVKKARERLQSLANAGNKHAEKVLSQFDEAVTEENWKKARQLCGETVQSNLKKFGKGIKTTAKWGRRIATLGLSTLFESDQEKPLTDAEIKQFTSKMNYLISNHNDKLAQRKLDAFEKAITEQKWDKARKIAKMPHKSLAAKAVKAYVDFFFGNDEKPMTEAEMTKFRESMGRKIQIGGPMGKVAQKKLDAFEDAVNSQRWKRARTIAQAKDDGLYAKVGKFVGKRIANNFRFVFGGDGKPMSENEINQARKEFNWAIQDGKRGAQKRLDLFEDYIKDEKWEKARKIAKMPYKNIVSRGLKAVGDTLFGNDKNAMTPQEIDKFRGELEQKIADNPGNNKKLNKILSEFNNAVELENWPKARKISGNKDWGFLGSVGKALKKVFNPLSWFSSDYEDCAKLKTKIEERIDEEGDDTGILSKGLSQFDVLVRRQQYDDAAKFGKDLVKLKIHEIASKHKIDTEEYKQMIADADKLRNDIIAAKKKTGFFDFMKKMRLSSLKNQLDSNPDQWSDPTFFEDLRDNLYEITGDKQYSDDIDKPDDQTLKDGQQLVQDIDKTADKFSWIGSPLIKSKLKALKSEVNSDIEAWDETAFSDWRSRLKEIAGEETIDSRSKDDQNRIDDNATEAQEKQMLEKGNARHYDKVNVEGNPFWGDDQNQQTEKFAKGGFAKKFADGGFSKSGVTKYDQLVDDLEGDKDLSPEDTYRATYYSDGTQDKPFKKPTEDDVVQVYGMNDKKNYLKLLNLARHAHKVGAWAVNHPEVYDEEEEHAGGVLNPLNWFARGGFTDQSKWLTEETSSVDADGNPIIAGEAGTEAIMPIRNKPGNLLSRIGTKLGKILSGHPVGPMSDSADSASVHAGTSESEPMENMMANELSKTVKSQYRSGGFSKFAGGGFFGKLFGPSRNEKLADKIADMVRSLYGVQEIIDMGCVRVDGDEVIVNLKMYLFIKGGMIDKEKSDQGLDMSGLYRSGDSGITVAEPVLRTLLSWKQLSNSDAEEVLELAGEKLVPYVKDAMGQIDSSTAMALGGFAKFAKGGFSKGNFNVDATAYIDKCYADGKNGLPFNSPSAATCKNDLFLELGQIKAFRAKCKEAYDQGKLDGFGDNNPGMSVDDVVEPTKSVSKEGTSDKTDKAEDKEEDSGWSLWGAIKKAGSAVADGAAAVGNGVVDGAKWVGEKTWDGTKAVGSGIASAGEATLDGAKWVGEKTWDGTKWVGGKALDGAEVVGSGLAAAGLGAAEVAGHVGRPVMDALMTQHPVNALEDAAMDLVTHATSRVASAVTPESTAKPPPPPEPPKQQPPPPASAIIAGGDDASKRLAEMVAINKQLLKIVSTAMASGAIKVEGLDTLTQVCAMAAQPKQSDESVATPHVPINPDQGLDLRKAQM